MVNRRLITFVVDVEEAYDYDTVRELIGTGAAELYIDRPMDSED